MEDCHWGFFQFDILFLAWCGVIDWGWGFSASPISADNANAQGSANRDATPSDEGVGVRGFALGNFGHQSGANQRPEGRERGRNNGDREEVLRVDSFRRLLPWRSRLPRPNRRRGPGLKRPAASGTRGAASPF